MATFVSLFRAINVGGNNKVPMGELKAMHEALGLRNVSAYLQTGNVVFESDESDPTPLAKQIKAEFEKKFGFSTAVLVRSGAELKALSEKNPFLDQTEKETKSVVVIFLTEYPVIEAVQELLTAYVGPEEIFVADKELFVYYSDGIGRSKLTNVLIERKLKVLGTGRNWNTVTKLVEMTQR